MNKQQRLRNAAEGFMAGLVACGYEGPWRWNSLDWELAFYRAWGDWAPRQRDPRQFPDFSLGSSRTSSQGRDMLRQLKATSPFHRYQDEPLTKEPFGLAPVEYLEIWVSGASPDEWIGLAKTFLAGMGRDS